MNNRVLITSFEERSIAYYQSEENMSYNVDVNDNFVSNRNRRRTRYEEVAQSA